MVIPLKTTLPPDSAAAVQALGRGHCTNDTTDAEREARIDILRLQLLGARDSDTRHELWQRLKAEISARSPAQIERMERAKGLRVP